MENIDTYCSQPGYRTELLQLAATHLKNVPDPTKLSNQELCQLLKKSDIDELPIKSQLSYGPILIPMIDEHNNYYDFTDAIAVQRHAIQSANSSFFRTPPEQVITKTDQGIRVTGQHAIKMLNASLRQDTLDLRWLINASSRQGQNLATEWGTLLYTQQDWNDAVTSFKKFILTKGTQYMYNWSRLHRPKNLETKSTKSIQNVTGSKSLTTLSNLPSEQSSTITNGLLHAKSLLISFEPAKKYINATQPIPLKILHNFLKDTNMEGMNGQLQTQTAEHAVIVYMWDMNKSLPINPLNLTMSHVKQMVQSEKLDTLLSEYFMSDDHINTWFTYVAAMLSRGHESDMERVDTDDGLSFYWADTIVDVNIHIMVENRLVHLNIDQVPQEIFDEHPDFRMIPIQPEISIGRFSLDKTKKWWSYLPQMLQEEYWKGALKLMTSLYDSIDPKVDPIALPYNAEDFMTQRFKENPTFAIKMIDVFVNPTREMQSAADRVLTSNRVQLSAISHDPHMIKLISEKGGNLSDLTQLIAVQKDVSLLQYILAQGIEPSENAQLSAVRQNIETIMWIIDANFTPHEQVQLEVVNADADNIDAILDKNVIPYEQVQLAAVQQKGNVLYSLLNKGIVPSDNVQLAAVQQDWIAILHILDKGITVSEEMQLAAVSTHGDVIKNIIDKGIVPTEKVQRFAVQNHPRALQYIRDPSPDVIQIARMDAPSEQMQLAMMRHNGNAISFIFEMGIIPSEQVQLAAVHQNGLAIKYIFDKIAIPVEKVQLAAVQQNGLAIRYILDNAVLPSEPVQLIAVEHNLIAFMRIVEYGITPSEQVQVMAVRNHQNAFYYMVSKGIKPCKQVQLVAVRQDENVINYIFAKGIKTYKPVQLATVQQNGLAIRYIYDAGIVPTEQIQVAAVRQNPDALQYIPHPSPSVRKAARIPGVWQPADLVESNQVY